MPTCFAKYLAQVKATETPMDCCSFWNFMMQCLNHHITFYYLV